MSAATHRTAGTAAATTAQQQNGNGIFQSVTGAVGNTVKGVGEDVSNTYTDVKKGIGDKLQNTPSNVANTPLAPGTSVPDLAQQASTGDGDGLHQSLQNITGIRTRNLFPGDVLPTSETLQTSLEDYFSVIRRQVAAELKKCVEKYLNYLRGKYPLFDILIDIEGYIQRQIADLRLQLQRKIRAELEKLIFQKLQLWQIAQYRQKIAGMIRKLCPKIPKKGSHSPTWIRRLQSDPTWKIVDGVTPVQTLAASSAATAAAIEDPDNAGQSFEALIDEIMVDAVDEAVLQSTGYNQDDMNTVIDAELVVEKSENMVNTVTLSKEEEIIALITTLSAQGLSKDEIIAQLIEMFGEGCRAIIVELVNRLCD